MVRKVGFTFFKPRVALLMKLWHRALFLISIIVLCFPQNSASQPFGLTQRVSVTGLQLPLDNPATSQLVRGLPNITFNQPVFVTAPPDGTDRLFVVEKTGTIKVVANSDSATTATVFLSISSKVSTSEEEGLLGLAFDPDYAVNGFFYVYYSAATGNDRSVISRFKVSSNPSIADSSSEKVIIQIAQPTYNNHKGGMIAFGLDKMLYIGLGDGGSAGDPNLTGQNCADMLASILRIDPHVPDNSAAPYAIPTDNPFAGSGSFNCGKLTSAPSRVCGVNGYVNGQICKEIYAYGARNPWRFSFDRTSGALWVGEVGQDAWEEIDIVRAGDNLGWNIFEGAHSYSNPSNLPLSNFRAPILEYPHSSAGGWSITGGYVYRGSALPTLFGKYIYADYVTGNVWALQYDGSAVVSNQKIATLGNIVSFGEDKNGELLAVNIVTGGIYRFQAAPVAGGSIPALLSQTGIFSNTATLQINPGAVEFDVNAPLWSDGSLKRRWLLLPGTTKIAFSATDAWTFPVGTALVKHFELPITQTTTRRLETRVFFRHNQGWAGYTYKWRANGSDADLLTDAVSETYQVETPGIPNVTRPQTWYYPSQVDCMRCHTASSGTVLGVRTQQLNRDFAYTAATDNQLRSWDHIGLFTTTLAAASTYGAYPTYTDTSKPIENRARAYLASNCAHCHQPAEPRSGVIDLRYNTTKSLMNIIDVRPLYGNVGLSDPYRVKTGSKESSVLWERIDRLDQLRMPPLASSVIDPTGVNLIGAWIDSLGGQPAVPAAPGGLRIVP